MYVAKLSFNQRSSHHRSVTRSPNHMCAISCSTVSARRSLAASVTRERKMYRSLKVTQPAFSIAPEFDSGMNTWSYLPKAYGYPKAGWKKSNPCRVISNSSSGSRYSASERRQ